MNKRVIAADEIFYKKELSLIFLSINRSVFSVILKSKTTQYLHKLL